MLVALGRILGHGLANDPLQLHRQARPQGGDGFRLFVANGIENGLLPLARKRQLSRHDFVDHNAQRPKVCRAVGGFAPRLLGRHIGRGAQHGLGFGELRAVGQQSQPEVHDGDELLGARACDHQVGRLDVAVNDLFLVRRFESSRRLDGDVERILQFERASLDLLLQRLAFEEGHGNVGAAICLRDFMDGADVRMI